MPYNNCKLAICKFRNGRGGGEMAGGEVSSIHDPYCLSQKKQALTSGVTSRGGEGKWRQSADVFHQENFADSQ